MIANHVSPTSQEEFTALSAQFVELQKKTTSVEVERNQIKRQQLITTDSLRRKYELELGSAAQQVEALEKSLARAQSDNKDAIMNQTRLTDKWYERARV